jgi:hypothetical protein
MPDVALDRRATRREVLEHRQRLTEIASAAGFENLRVTADGALVVHPSDLGYRATVHFARQASDVVGAWVQTITDDAPAAAGETSPL